MQKQIMDFTKEAAINRLSQKYETIIRNIRGGGIWVWGTGKLGQFVREQCLNNNIKIKGFIDNDASKWNEDKYVFSYNVIEHQDTVILASSCYPEIIEQLDAMGIKNYIYYEELAFLMKGLRTYSYTFSNMFEELETNRENYKNVYDLLEDSLSKEIYTNLLMFRCTLELKYTKEALRLSLQEGTQDFDRKIVCKLDDEYSFFDVGGYDGASTIEYVAHAQKYNKIYFFEPDKTIMENTKRKLKDYEKIEFIQAGVGECVAVRNFNSTGGSGGSFIEDGQERVEIVKLDDYVNNHKSYIKMDIEGYELSALRGAEQCIRQYKPMLSVSVYHLPGDIHRLINLILQWNPGYKVYLRHYTNMIADTRAYFIDEGEESVKTVR